MSNKVEDVNQKNEEGQTPLHDAASSGNKEICQVILEHMAKNGETSNPSDNKGKDSKYK